MSTTPRETDKPTLLSYRGFNMERTRWSIDFQSAADYEDMDRKEVTYWQEANAISSLMVNGLHCPAIDLDVPAMLIDSSSYGHSHLYINVEMSWFRYRVLLRVLVWCGIIEKGYYKACVRRKQSHLRLPEVKK